MTKIEKSAVSNLFEDIKHLVEQDKSRIAVSVNAEITRVYWKIGTRIRIELLQEQRVEYGKKIIKQLAIGLTQQYGPGWSEKQLRHCLRIVETFPDETIVSSLSRQLSWSLLKEMNYIDDPLKREFYIEISKLEKWSLRTLRDRIQSMLYERTAISKKPDYHPKKSCSIN